MRSAQAIFPARTKGKTYAMWNTVNISWLEWSLSAACCDFYCKGQAGWMCRPQVANISLGPASWRSSADRSSAGASRQLSTSLTGQVQVHQGNSSHPCIFFSWWLVLSNLCWDLLSPLLLLFLLEWIIFSVPLISLLPVCLLLFLQLTVLFCLHQRKLPSTQKFTEDSLIRQGFSQHIRKILQSIYPANMSTWKAYCLS